MSDVAILGVGMHPWGKWGKSFVEYGAVAARAALADAGLSWDDVDYLAAGNTMRNGYPGYVSGSTFAQALGWRGVPVSSSYAACASGAVAIEAARARIRAGMADVAVVVGADTAPKGFFGPLPGERPEDPDWLRFHVLGATNPTYFALYARRRMELYGTTTKDFAAVKVKNSRHGLSNPNARYRKEFTEDDIAESPVVADPLRLVDICATSDGGAAVVLASAEYAAKMADRGRHVRIAGLSTVTPSYPNTYLDMPDIATDSAVGAPAAPRPFRDAIAHAAYEEAGLGPDDISCAEVYDLSTALELDWYENIGLCAPGEAEALLHSGATTLGGRVPVNPSGGLACFGEAIPAQAIAQVCELTWQVRGEAGQRQVEGANVGLSINQGLFGHGSCVIVTA
ncbi:MAG TPA: lipid-transfer protein [Acidimicrobiia bacterium]|nr:lipid-transfer protein [Acidimicrobiia bacterium]HSG14687.1 lipid-transfer protein [Gaiellaceae bacterium]